MSERIRCIDVMRFRHRTEKEKKPAGAMTYLKHAQYRIDTLYKNRRAHKLRGILKLKYTCARTHHTDTHARMHPPTQHTHSYTYTHSIAHTHTQLRTRTSTHTHTRTLTHTHNV